MVCIFANSSEVLGTGCTLFLDLSAVNAIVSQHAVPAPFALFFFFFFWGRENSCSLILVKFDLAQGGEPSRIVPSDDDRLSIV